MKYSLGISNFLEEISSLSHSVVCLYFFALIAEEGFLISSCYPLEASIPPIKKIKTKLSTKITLPIAIENFRYFTKNSVILYSNKEKN